MKLMKKSHTLAIFIIVIACIVTATIISILLLDQHSVAPAAKSISIVTPSPEILPPTVPTFDKNLYLTTDPSSIWVIANKKHPLIPKDYIPADLVKVHGGIVSSKIEPDLDQMIADASSQGVTLTLPSSYRSYSYQLGLYNGYVAQDGVSGADTYSARPGYSEHQTGLAIDFGGITKPSCNIQDCYAGTKEGMWLKTNANDYGFILRYTAEKQPVTGYVNEAWHYRYVGKDLTTEMKKKSITTLEEFFGVSGGESY
jgi:D-alanyl-D-alanine carboxypeptidase